MNDMGLGPCACSIFWDIVCVAMFKCNLLHSTEKGKLSLLGCTIPPITASISMACSTSRLLPIPASPTPTTAPPTLALLQMCSCIQEVKQLHAQLVVSGLVDHPLSARRLLESYVNASEIHYALSILDRTPYPDVFVYNTTIRGLTSSKFPYRSLLLYNQLLLGCLVPDNYTYTFVLKACSHLKALFEGKQVHCSLIKAGIAPDTHVHGSLIHMYSSCGSVDDAERVLGEFAEENTLAKNAMITGYLSEGQVDKARTIFDSMIAKDVATWSAMVTGYSKNGMYCEALALFRDLMHLKIRPNESMLVSVLSACANLGALHQGTWIHRYIHKIGFKMSNTLCTALINMYAKCGSVEYGYELFCNTCQRQRDIVMWGAMMSGFAIHGQARKCFELFDEMLAEGIQPNEVIFVAILSACSHAGHVQKGRLYFNQMVHSFGIQPSVEHYGCMVDLLGRAGHLAEAEELILSMSEQPTSVIWGSLLSACRIHNEISAGTWAFRNLVMLEPASGDRYKLAGLMFAKAGRREEATMMREIIVKNEMETTCGSSSIEVDGNVHEFVVGDSINNKAKEIYEVREGINRLLADAHDSADCSYVCL